MGKTITVETVSHGTNAVLETSKLEFDKDIHKIVVNIDTGHLLKCGANVSYEVATTHKLVLDFLKSDNPVLTLPEWIVIRTVDISGIKEGKNNEGNNKPSSILQP